jgi:hypothetical protein
MDDIDEPVPVLCRELSREKMGNADAWDSSEVTDISDRNENGRTIRRYKLGPGSFIEFTDSGGGKVLATDMSGVGFVWFESRLRFRRDPSANV